MSGIRPGFNGLPSRPQGLPAQPQAGPSRQPGHHQRRTTHPQQQQQHQQQQQQQQQQQRQHHQAQPAFITPYPYAIPNASGGYQPFPGYPVPPTFSPNYPDYRQGAYPYRPTATPEGYTYSSTYSYDAPNVVPVAHNRAQTALSYVAPAASIPPVPVPTVKSWRNCSHPACKFVGSGEDVEIHEGDRHLIFPNGKPVERSEEEEKWAHHKGPPPPIEGTSIVLGTEEDIAKWRAERKANWPSAKRIAEREEERQAAIARGEHPDRGRGRGRGGSRGGRRADAAAQAEDWGRPAREESASTSLGGRGGGRGRGQERGRGAGRGRGGRHNTSDQSTSSNTIPVGTGSEIKSEHLPTPVPEPKRKRSVSNASASGKSDSGSDSSDTDSSSGSASGDEDIQEAAPTTAPGPAVEPPMPSKPMCHAFVRTGRCRNGPKCRYSHAVDGKPQAAGPSSSRAQGPKPLPPKKINPFDRPSMLGALLATPIQNTLSQLTQTIRFLVANDMLQGVELIPGDAEEQARAQTKVTLVEPVSGDEPEVQQDS